MERLLENAVIHRGEQRPILELSRSGLERTFEVIAALVLLLQIFLLLAHWGDLPDSILVHFGPSGAPDSWGSKYLLFILPGVSAAIYTLLTVLSRFPHRYNYLVTITVKNAELQYSLGRTFLTILKAEIVLLFTYIVWVTIQVVHGESEGLGTFFLPTLLVLIFGSIAVYMVLSIKNK
jgi:hypothetical protein